MRTVVRPAGPLPPQVYWKRRLVLLVVLALVAVTVWWFGGARSSADEGRQATGAAGSSADPSAGRQHQAGSGTRPPRSPQQRTPPADDRPTRSENRRQRRHPVALPDPSAPCRPADVDLEISAKDSSPGKPNTAKLSFRSTKLAACTLPLTPDAMVIRVTSGDDLVWSSDDCPDALPVKQLVARKKVPAEYSFRWDGTRSAENCQPVSELPRPGGYWFEAALIGGEPHRAYFDIAPAGRS